MKQFSLFLLVTIFLVGCSKSDQPSALSVVEKDAIDYYGSVVTLSDFPKAKLFDCNDSQLLALNGVGKTPESAMVILAFDQDAVLFTAKRYNGELVSVSSDFSTSYCTDLQTFASVTGLKEANHQYAIPEGSLENPYWIFDPYVRSFSETLKHKENVLQNKPFQSFKSTTPNWGLKGAIIYANWSNNGVADYYGHIGTVSQSPSSSSTDVGYLMRSTKTIEASNDKTGLSGMLTALLASTPNGVYQRFMSTNGTNLWNHSIVYNRSAMWLPNMTTTQRNNVVAYLNLQIGDAYSFPSSRTSTDKWYCSKLAWAAYLSATGIDVDANGGTIWPSDLRFSPQLVGMSFGLEKVLV